jgi:(4S)-4-hydroxy-5-phosphonooxypentane-2,3-dione isomerase
MLVVHVDIRVKPGMQDAFVAATKPNVEQSRLEPGIAAFDLLVDPSDAQHFMLVEVYRTAQSPVAHKQTEHYAIWRDAVEVMMAVPRTSSKWDALLAGYVE